MHRVKQQTLFQDHKIEKRLVNKKQFKTVQLSSVSAIRS